MVIDHDEMANVSHSNSIPVTFITWSRTARFCLASLKLEVQPSILTFQSQALIG